MDGFDDLLNPSRAALEQNPFADDPFSRRSGSPDPWATPFGATDTTDAFGGSTAGHFATSDAFGSVSNAFEDIESTEPNPVESDPLDSAAHNAEDDNDNEPLASKLKTPGFRESVPPTPVSTDDKTTHAFSETETIRLPPSLEEADKIPALLAESRTPAPKAESSPTRTTSISAAPEPPKTSPIRSNSPLSSHRPSGSLSGIKSPLDPTPTNFERPIAGLSLGGEALGGWGHADDQAPWQTETTYSAPPPAHVPEDEDSDDDKPIMQTLQNKQLQQDLETSGQVKNGQGGIAPVFSISVDDPQKVGDPIRSFTMYTVHTRTTSPLFQKSAFSVLRRYSDFLWLYETLSGNNPGVVVPPVPEKNPFGRFDDHFVKQRRLGLEKCIQKIANHPVLMKDPDLRFFLESDNFALDIKHRKAELAYERGGFIASLGQAVAGPRFYETDEWFDRQKVYLDSLESQLRGLVKAIELVAKHRQELSIANGEFAQNVSDLAASDVGKQLAQSLSGLADVQQKAQDLQTIQADQDMTTFLGTADEYARLINSVRLAFSSRIRVYHSWKNSESELLRTKQTHERNRSQGRIPAERLGYSLSQIAEAERRAAESKLEFEQVSKLVKAEVARFEQERIEDFKDSLEAFLEGMISRQKELIASWENYQQNLLNRVGGGGQAAVQAIGQPS